MLNAARRTYTLFRLLSLDVVLGAVLGAKIVAVLNGVNVPDDTLLLLAVSVWLIYTGDHLIDAHKMNSNCGRHYFYFRHRRPLIITIVIMICYAIWLLLLQPYAIIFYGSISLISVAAYLFLINHYSFFRNHLKEFSCALIYAIGICLPTFAFGTNLGYSFYLIFAFYVLSAWINLLTISIIEKDYDHDAGFGSLAQHIGEERTLFAINLLFVFTALVISAFVWFQNFSPVLLIFTFMAGIQFLLVLNRSRLLENERYRTFGDLVYVLPVIVLLIH